MSMRKHAVTERAAFSILLFISAAFVRLLLHRGTVRGDRGAEKLQASLRNAIIPIFADRGNLLVSAVARSAVMS